MERASQGHDQLAQKVFEGDGIALRLPLPACQTLANRDKAKSDLDATTTKVMIELRKRFSAAQSSIAKIAALQKNGRFSKA